MNKGAFDYLYIFGTVLFTVYGQIIIKHGLNGKSDIPAKIDEKLYYLVKLIIDPYILSGFISAYIASIMWMAALTKFELSVAYPFMSLSFVFVLIFSCLYLNEALNYYKIIGIAFIIVGVLIISKGF